MGNHTVHYKQTAAVSGSLRRECGRNENFMCTENFSSNSIMLTPQLHIENLWQLSHGSAT
jgi:hypothetical protein